MKSALFSKALFALMVALAWVLTAMPRRVSLAIGALLGRLLAVLGWKRTLIQSNLLLAFPGAFPGASPDAERFRSDIERGFYRHFGRLFLEILIQYSPAWREWVQEQVVVHGRENWERAHAQGKGVLFVSNHVGNWEAMAAGMALAGADVLIVTKHLKPEWIHLSMERNRLKAGVRGTYEPKTLRDVLAHLKRGGTVGFVIDQYAGAPIGIRVPFFGVPVGTLSAPAIVARRTGAVVLPVYNWRDPDGRFQMWIGEPFPAFQGNSPRELASQLALWVESTEKSVRKCPEQWLWSHRRFKGDLSPMAADEWDRPRERES